jgi:hypothetical protein
MNESPVSDDMKIMLTPESPERLTPEVISHIKVVTDADN